MNKIRTEFEKKAWRQGGVVRLAWFGHRWKTRKNYLHWNIFWIKFYEKKVKKKINKKPMKTVGNYLKIGGVCGTKRKYL